MSSSYNFKDNLTIDNNKYLKWLDITGTSRSNIISLDNLNNVKINSAFGNLVLNSESNNSYTFLNVNGNASGVIIGSKLGIGFNTTTNMNSILTLNKNNFIGINTTTGSNDGYLGLAGSSSLNTTGSRIILYGNDINGRLNLYAGNTANGTINLFTGNDIMRLQILNNGTLNVLPDGITSRLIINDTNSTFTNNVILSSGTASTNATTGALRVSGGIGITGSVYIEGSLSLTTTSVGNLNFSSSNSSTSYSSGAIVLNGGLGISNTVNSSSVTAGGGLSIAGGAAIGKDVYIGGKLNVLNSTVATSSENASVVLYGGLGINNNILLRSNFNPQIKLSPITDQGETSICFYSKNNFSETSNTGSSWTLGQNVNSVSSGNFALKNSQFGNVLSATYSGNVGIGAISPLAELHLATGNTYNNILFEPGYTSDGLNPGWGSINFNGYHNTGEQRINTSKNRWRILVDQRTTNDSMAIDIFNGTTLTTLISFATSGNVSIPNLVNTNQNSTNISTATLNVSSQARINGPGGVGSNGSLLITGADNFGHSLYVASVASQKRIVFNNNGTIGNIFAYDYGSSQPQDLLLQGPGGNVGIGAGSPSAKLHTVLGDATDAGSTNFWDSTYAVFGKSSNTGGAVGIGFNSVSGGSLSSLSPNVAWQAMRYRAADHRFIVAGDASTPPTLVVANSGNVGIGTTAPNLVFGGTMENVRLAVINNVGGGEGGISRILIGANNYHYSLIEAGHPNSGHTYLAFGTSTSPAAPTEKMRITREGDIGIGTTSPTHKLEVAGSIAQYSSSATNFNGYLKTNRLNQANNTQLNPGILVFGDSSTGFPYGMDLGYNSTSLRYRNRIFAPDNSDITFSFLSSGSPPTSQSGFTDRMVVTGGGSVGIGTVSPQTTLHVNGGLQLGTADANGFHFATVSGALNAYSGTWGFGTVRFCCDSSGNFGIGTLNPPGHLSLNKPIGTQTNFSIQTGSNTRFWISTAAGLGDDVLSIGGSGGTAPTQGVLNINGDNPNNLGINTRSPFSSVCINTDDAGGFGALQVQSLSSSINFGKSQDGATFRPWSDNNNIIDFRNTASVLRGSISGNGSGAVNYNTTSDRRLKENVTNLNNGIDIIKQIRPVEFTWRSDNKRDFGFIAQEFYQVIPGMRPNFSNYSHCDCNTTDISNGILCDCEEHNHDEPVDKNGNPLYYGLDYGRITPYLTKALQETISELEKLRQDFEEYKNTHP